MTKSLKFKELKFEGLEIAWLIDDIIEAGRGKHKVI